MSYKILALIFILLLSTPIKASFWQKCIFKATLLESKDKAQKVSLKEVIKADGHDINCDRHLGEKSIELKKMGPLKVGEKFKLEYDYYNGRGPNGVVNSTTWTCLDCETKK